MPLHKRQTIDYVLYPLLLIPIFFFPSIQDVFNLPKLWLLISLTVGIILHFILNLRQIKSGDSVWKRRILVLTITMIATLSVCSFLTESTLSRILFGLPSRANGLLYFICIFALLGVAASSGTSMGFLKRSIRIAQIPLTLNLVYCTIQYFGIDPIAWNNPYNPMIGTFGNPNFSGAVLGISSSVFLLLSLEAAGLWKWTFILLSVYSFVLSFLTESLQGPLIASIGILIIYAKKISKEISKRQLLLFLIGCSILALFLIISFFGYGPLGNLLYQYTLRLRFEYWRIGLKTTLSNPFTGIGPDSYIEGFSLFRSESFIDTYGVGLRSDSAHSSPLNFLANFGFVPFVLYILVVMVITYFSVKQLFGVSGVKIDEKAFALMWILFLIQSLISIEQIGLGVLQWLSGGLVLHFAFNDYRNASTLESSRNRSIQNSISTSYAQKGKFSAMSGEAAVCSFLIAAFLASPPLSDEIKLANIASANYQDPEVQKLVGVEVKSLSTFALEDFRRARVVTNYYLNIGDVDSAMQVLTTITEKDPQSVDAWSQIAKIENFRGRYAEEIVARRTILTLDPLGYQNMLELSNAYLKLEKWNLAILFAKKVSKLAEENIEGVQARKLIEELKTAQAMVEN